MPQRLIAPAVRTAALAALTALALLPVACRRSEGDSAAPRPERPPRSGTAQYLIEGDEIRATTAQNLYEVIRIRRPSWLNRTVRNLRGDNAVAVYLDDRMVGLLNLLRDMPPYVAARLEYLSPTEAQVRFGPNHGIRAAVVVTSARP